MAVSSEGGATSTVASFRALSLPARVLVLNQFGGNAGFFMLVPFLAAYLTGLGYSAATVGLVLALRNLSQQGLFLVGGSLGDRLGYRPVMLVGAGMRVGGFGLFAAVDTLAGLVAAAVLTGVAGALFIPALRAYLVREAGGRRAEAFAVFTVMGQAGSLVGPLVGAALLAVDFRLVALTAAAAFGVLAVAVLVTLPRERFRPAPDPGDLGGTARPLGSWRGVITDGRFLVFSLGASGFLVLQNQLYLVLPLEATRVTGRAEATGAVLVVATLVGVLGAVRAVAWCRSRWSDGRSLATGLAVMGAAFLLPGVAGAGLASVPAGSLGVPEALLRGTPVLLGAMVLGLGAVLTDPFTMALVPRVGRPALAGTYYGWSMMVAGLVVVGVNTGVGALLDRADTVPRVLPFLVLVGVGAAGAAVIATMQRRGALTADRGGGGSR